MLALKKWRRRGRVGARALYQIVKNVNERENRKKRELKGKEMRKGNFP